MIKRPFKRIARPLTDESYRNGGNSSYILDKEYTNDPQHYIRAFLLIQEDLQEIFRYIDPNDLNDKTISLKNHELLVRTCIEVEANLNAILSENEYSKNENNFKMKDDYCLIEQTHKLSKYQVKLPIWTGNNNIITPFKDWINVSPIKWKSLSWYSAYNKSKHNRHLYFEKATFRNVIDSIAGLLVILSAQFHREDFSTNPKGMCLSGPYSYDYDPLFEQGIGGYFIVKFPTDWNEVEKYDFQWRNLKDQVDKVDKFNYNQLRSTYK